MLFFTVLFKRAEQSFRGEIIRLSEELQSSVLLVCTVNHITNLKKLQWNGKLWEKEEDWEDFLFIYKNTGVTKYPFLNVCRPCIALIKHQSNTQTTNIPPYTQDHTQKRWIKSPWVDLLLHLPWSTKIHNIKDHLEADQTFTAGELRRGFVSGVRTIPFPIISVSNSGKVVLRFGKNLDYCIIVSYQNRWC